jgi:hypothetical protein
VGTSLESTHDMMKAWCGRGGGLDCEARPTIMSQY